MVHQPGARERWVAEEEDNVETEEQEDERSTLRGVSDSVRKAITSGFRTVLSSEEWIRGTVAEAMPKELVTYIKGTTDSAKDEVVRVIGTQVSKFLEGVDIGGEIQKILTSLSFEVKTEIRFIPNDKSVKPDVKFTVRPKRQKAEPSDEED